MRYRVEVRPDPRYQTVLYLARRYREKHDGPFTESFSNRMTWLKRKTAERHLAAERDRGFNRTWGHLTFTIVEEPEE